MRLYDYPHPFARGRIIRGYDRPHAVRTARMCVAVATALGHGAERVCQYQIACLLHDLGRAGLDRQLFRENLVLGQGARHSDKATGMEGHPPGDDLWAGNGGVSPVDIERSLKPTAFAMTPWAKEQVEMRLGYSRRLGPSAAYGSTRDQEDGGDAGRLGCSR